MSRSPSAVRTVRCPGCGAACAYAVENPYRPFCSARCKNHDFGAWASERFSLDADAAIDADARAEAVRPDGDAEASALVKPAQRDNQ